MKTKEQKLAYVISELEKIDTNVLLGFSWYLKKAQSSLKEEYTKRAEELENITPKFIKSFDFCAQLYQRAERYERRSLAQKLHSTKFLGIETHAYAPELNTAKFKKSYSPETFDIKVRGVVNQKELINYLSNFSKADLDKYLQL